MNKNKIVCPEYPHDDSFFYKSEVRYRSKTDGNLTTDVNDAVTDMNGVPVVVSIDASSNPDDSAIRVRSSFTLNPKDPVSRSACRSNFALLNKKDSSANFYMDKIDAQNYANNVSSALSKNISKTLKNSKK